MNYQLWNEDFLLGVKKIEDNSIDLIVTDPPYCLGKDYGNNSDQKFFLQNFCVGQKNGYN